MEMVSDCVKDIQTQILILGFIILVGQIKETIAIKGLQGLETRNTISFLRTLLFILKAQKNSDKLIHYSTYTEPRTE